MFKIEQTKTDGTTVWVSLAGDITESSDFGPLLDIAGQTLILDLAGVTRINSPGVKAWVGMVAAIEKTGKKLVLERCSVPVVHQLNLMSSFRGRGVIASVFAPYYCTSCDQDHRHLIEFTNDQQVGDLDEMLACPDCGESMEFDEIADSYLGFRTEGKKASRA